MHVDAIAAYELHKWHATQDMASPSSSSAVQLIVSILQSYILSICRFWIELCTTAHLYTCSSTDEVGSVYFRLPSLSYDDMMINQRNSPWVGAVVANSANSSARDFRLTIFAVLEGYRSQIRCVFRGRWWQLRMASF